LDFKNYIDNLINLVNNFLINNLSNSVSKELKEAMLYSINAGGKRIRPILCIAVWEMLSKISKKKQDIKAELTLKDYNKILPLACSFELIHTYSLIHDDLPSMDNDDYRRGKLTNHKVYGEAMAILAGDALLTESFFILSLLQDYFEASKVLKVNKLIALAAGAAGMVGGQALDIANVKQKEIDKTYLKEVNSAKTGALIKAACLSPAILLGEEEQAFETYGSALGYAFQLTDDVLGALSSKEILGKTPNLDEKNNKITYINIYGVDKTLELAKTEIKKAKDALKNYSTEYKENLINIADYVINRKF